MGKYSSLIRTAKKYEKSREYQKAVVTYFEAMAIKSTDYVRWRHIGYLCRDACMYDKAAEAFTHAFELDPNHIGTINDLSISYTNSGNHEKALEFNDRAIALDPSNPNLWLNKGFIYSNMKSYSKAIESYKKSIEIDSRFISGWDNIVATYNDMGEYDNALEVAKETVRVSPFYALGWNNLAYTHYLRKEYNLAMKAVEKALDLERHFEIALATQAEIYCGMGDYDKAIEVCKKIENYPVEVFKICKKCLDINPNHDEAKAVIKSLTARFKYNKYSN